MTRIAAIQIGAHSDKEVNIRKASEMIEAAARQGAQIMCLPEMFNAVYFCVEEDIKHFSLAEPVPGPTVDRLAELACKTNTVIICPIFEKVLTGEYYNTAVVLGVKGEIIGKYRKSSIPYPPSPSNKEPLGKEKFYFKPGNLGYPSFPTPFGVRIGILICYDRHFPEAARAVALSGADILFVPTCTSSPLGKPVWELELKAHAQANIYYVCGVNRVGVDVGGSARNHFGSSMIVDPKAEILSQASDDKEEIILADIDSSLIATVRNSWGFYRDRRPDTYHSLIE